MTPATPLSAPSRPGTDAQVSAPAPVQLLLPLKPPPGRCACGLKLSVANTDGACDACRDLPLPDADAPLPPKSSPWLTLICECGESFLARHKDKQYCPLCTRRRHTECQERRKVTA